MTHPNKKIVQLVLTDQLNFDQICFAIRSGKYKVLKLLLKKFGYLGFKKLGQF